jgi:gamma-glutamylputrescine oxidase
MVTAGLYPTSWWLATASAGDPPSAGVLPPTAEVVVLGGGLMGVSVAYWLGRAGRNVLVVEAGRLACGATGRNAGLMLSGNSPLEDPALLTQVRNEEHLEVDVATPGHLALITSGERWDKVRQEARQSENSPRSIKALGRGECEDLLRRRILDHFRGGRWFPQGSVINPVRLVHGLAAAAQRRGVVFVADTHFVEIGDGGGSGEWEVKTARGIVRAEHVVFACSAAVTDFIPTLRPVLEPIRGQVLATEPLPPLFPMAMAVDWGTVYWRQTQEGVIVLGGYRALDPATETSREECLNPSIQEALTGFLPQAFPGFPPFRVSHRWAGIMDYPVDGRPLIGALPGLARHWVIAGFGGHGLPVGIGAGKALAEVILTGRTPLALERYDPARFFQGH